jgi:hypothetical protein
MQIAFNPYELPVGRHVGKSPSHPNQIYVVSEHRGVKIVAEYDRFDLETETAFSFVLNGEVHEGGNGMDLNDMIAMLDDMLDAEDEEPDADAFAMLGVPRL